MGLTDLSNGQHYPVIPHGYVNVAYGDVMPVYIHEGDCATTVVIVNEKKVEFIVWNKLDSDRVNFEIGGVWMFVDSPELNKLIRAPGKHPLRFRLED